MQSNSGATFVVHNLADARRALEIAVQSGTDVTLLSAPSAASLLGPRVFNDMISAAVADVKCDGIDVDAAIDCGDAAGPALRAIAEGAKHIVTHAPQEVVSKITEIANAKDVQVTRGPMPSNPIS